MDLQSTLIGAIIVVITAILVFEYQHWREHRTDIKGKKKETVSLLRTKINETILNWENFKKTDEMQIGSAFSNFLYELESTGRFCRNIASASETLFSKDELDKIIEVANELTRLSQKQFYINGGRSWNEFLELGNKIVEQCKEIYQKMVKYA